MIDFKKVLIIAAHPDDDILGCGGLLAKYKDDSNVFFKVLFLGEGSSCRYQKEDIYLDEVQKTIEQRNQYAVNALRLLNIDEYSFYNFMCGRFDKVDLIDIGKTIEHEIDSFKPDTIFTHSEHDVNNDHQITFQATLQATRPGAQNFVRNILSFEVLSSSEWRYLNSFEPNIFIELSQNDVELKIKALNEYISEIKPFPFPRSNEGITVLSNYRGMQVAKKYVEAYKLIRGVIK